MKLMATAYRRQPSAQTGHGAVVQKMAALGEPNPLRMTINLVPIATLTGRVVTRWSGTEMALAEGRENRGVCWEDSAVPFLQFTHLDLQIDTGQVLRLLSQIEDGSSHHGFYLEEIDEPGALRVSDDPTSIFRDRTLTELPLGEIRIVDLRQDGPNAIVEIRLALSDSEIRLVAAEVYEEHDDSLRVVERDESILIQLNGERPSLPA
jgi:hypothetical protein